MMANVGQVEGAPGGAARDAAAALDVVLDGEYSIGFPRSRPLQRVWRDLEVATRNQVLSVDFLARSTTAGCLSIPDG